LLAAPRSQALAEVAAVVLNWNGWQDTLECLDSLLRSEVVPAHIVVCDNGSIDGSLEHLREWAVRNALPYESFPSPADAMAAASAAQLRAPVIFIANGENRGFAAGNNVGIRFAVERTAAKFVWILNNDVVVGRSALGRMLDTASCEQGIGMVGSALLRYDDPSTVQALGGGYILPVICHDTQLGSGWDIAKVVKESIAVHHLIGASLLVRADAIRDVGLMDESYFLYREETDWCIAMRRRGWALRCRTDASVWHKQSRSIGFKSPMHDYYAVRNVLRLVRKFYPAFVPTAFGYYALRSLAPKVLRLEFERIGAVMRALGDFVRGVDGRPVHHTDALLLDQYVPESHPEEAPLELPDARVMERGLRH
jgi:GT2 family glycosyltransferase